MLKATHSGKLKIGNMMFPCSVLSDGTRILTQTSFMQTMGMYYSGWVAKEGPAEMPHFLAFKGLKPFVDKHLKDLQLAVKYRTENNQLAYGILATIIPNICEVWIDANEVIKLGSRQKKIAEKALIIMRALAHVGIVALIDETTGYQEVRNRQALEKILDKYLQPYQARWAKRFPDDFYKEIFRLKGWQWQGMSVNRPQVVGHYTNDIVYKRIAPGLLTELQQLNPITNDGERVHKHHQWLTDDFVQPELHSHLLGVAAIMRTVTYKDSPQAWDEFMRRLQRSYPKKNTNFDLDFDE